MKFGYTILYVPDVTKALNFYQAAFGFPLKFLHESEQYGELETGAVTLAFVTEDLVNNSGIGFIPNRIENKSPGIELAFVTNDVEQAYKKALAAGAVLVKQPEQKPWGQVVAYVRDMNGVLVELCSPL